MDSGNCDDDNDSPDIVREKPPKSSYKRQMLAASIGCTNGFSMGLNVGYTSVGLDSLQSKGDSGNAPFKITDQEVGLFGSTLNFAGMVGTIFGGFLSTRYGRKWPNICLQFPCAIGWILMVFSTDLYVMLAGQMLCGFAQGVRVSIGRTFIGEIAHPEYRGRFLSFGFVLYMAGALFMYIFALFLDWQALAMLNSVVSLVLLPVQIFIPESHVWLISQGRLEEAKKAFQWFRGENYPCEKEFSAAVGHQEETKKAVTKIKDILNYAYLKPVIIVVICIFLRQCSGNTAIMYFMVQILKLANSGIEPKYAVIVLGTLQLSCIAISGRIMDKLGRKKATVMSSVLTGFSQMGMGAYLYVQDAPSLTHLAERYNWLPLVLLSASMISYSLGLASIIVVLLGEILPLQIKDVTGGILSFFNEGFTFVALAVFYHLMEVAKPPGTFWIFAICCFILAAFFLSAMPETKGESLQDIEKRLTRNKTKNTAKTVVLDSQTISK